MKSVPILTVLFISIILSVSAYAQKRILHISSYNRDYPWTRSCSEGIESVLKKDYIIKNLYLNTKVIPERMFRKAADNTLKKALKFNPDIVILGDDNALKLLGPLITNIKIPIVYYGINNNPRNYFDGRIPDNVYGLIERPLIIPMYRYIKGMIPDLKRILVLFDKSVSSNGIISTAFYGKESITVKDVDFDIKIFERWTDWKKNIINAGEKYQAIIIANHFTVKNSMGKTLTNWNVMKRASKLSEIPIFAMNDYAVHSNGAVGAMVIEGYDHGIQTAEIVKSILEGKKNITKHVVQKGGKVFFNKVQLKRFNLKLPDNIADKVTFR